MFYISWRILKIRTLSTTVLFLKLFDLNTKQTFHRLFLLVSFNSFFKIIRWLATFGFRRYNLLSQRHTYSMFNWFWLLKYFKFRALSILWTSFNIQVYYHRFFALCFSNVQLSWFLLYLLRILLLQHLFTLFL